ncbi:MAG: hypothetical protein KKB20_19465 [Proteobacteria bacterium]|nr:hypothetical protein [Pseudomonadota bacterium]
MNDPYPDLLERARGPARSCYPELAALLSGLPPTTCRRKASCCALMPPMSLLEACRLFDAVVALPEPTGRDLLLRCLDYYFLNPVRIMGCPFLQDAGCLLYADRPFGCRAYGLWSPGRYRRQRDQAEKGQKAVQKAWLNLGVTLPRSVVNHRPPYCRDVSTADGSTIYDRELEAVRQGLDDLDRRLGAEGLAFSRHFVGDLSFLTASILLGREAALHGKVAVVREALRGGADSELDYLRDRAGDRVGRIRGLRDPGA